VLKVAIAGVAACALGAAVLAAPASAEEPLGDSTVAAPATGSIARGLIVQADPGVGPNAATRAALRATIGEPGDPVRITPETTVVAFDTDLPLEQAQQLAAEVSARPGIAWAEPDVLLTPAEQVFPNDPLFADQWYLWDAGAPDGGFSARSPDIWGVTTGTKDVVVAVIDTGVAAHPDLAGTVVAGYDFVSNIPMANDGDSWDPNPADPGDWVTSADLASGQFPSTCTQTSNSSWHGTHVAGITAAVQDNDYGISGAAPGLTVLNVRALGKCGGFLSDIAAAVRWSVGEVVLDRTTGQPLPLNPTPAKVINLSLGGIAECSTAMTEAIGIARSRGAIVIAAAGNDSRPIADYVPANCSGVVSVVATDRTGARASYSNYGTDADPATIAAPGGGSLTAILATDNTGREGPEQPSFGNKRGTSMATPIVSAAAGLLHTLGITAVDEVRQRLIESVQPFPTGIANACTTIECGAGVVDFGALFDAITLTGRRGMVRDRTGVIVDGATLGLPEGTLVTPYVRFPGQTEYSEGVGVRRVEIVAGVQGQFTWQRRTGKRVYVYFRAETGERSQRIIVPAR